MNHISRLEFLKSAAAISLGFTGFHKLLMSSATNSINPALAKENFGPLIPDPEGILDLPKDFSYKVISRAGDLMSDGFKVPGRPDGMAAFALDEKRVILIRNHEISSSSEAGAGSAFGENYELLEKIDSKMLYDAGKKGIPANGGTTTIVFNLETQEIEKEYLSLGGTLRNCAGGPTPWNTWLTCEEIVFRANEDYAKDHGYVFEVPASADILLVDPIPIKDMGRFNHEAVCVDPDSGVIYLTEDDSTGLIYRFIPNIPGKMHEGGVLQALKAKGRPSLDSRNWEEDTVAIGESLETEWIDLENIDDDDLRIRGFEQGAVRFARGEGMWYGENAVFFACTNGGRNKRGQIWKYIPSPHEGTEKESESPGKLELFVEPNDGSVIENADNLTVAPWGDLIVCEDGPNENFILGVTPEGAVYKLAKNAISNSETAGATFSPDGSTLFMNIQQDALTIAITGPWHNKG